MKYRSSSGWATICMIRAPLIPSFPAGREARSWGGAFGAGFFLPSESVVQPAAAMATRPATTVRRVGRTVTELSRGYAGRSYRLGTGKIGLQEGVQKPGAAVEILFRGESVVQAEHVSVT
ncbi:hypothetical protein GCM10020254_41070 [Streptomyces goshikiensis]